MSDHILKKNQAKAGHASAHGVKLKPVPGATTLILDGAKAVVFNNGANDKVRETDREMDLTFYDANGNVETADCDGDISMKDETTIQSVIEDEGVSGFTPPSDGVTDLTSGTRPRGGSVPVSINYKEHFALTPPCHNTATDGDSEMP